MEPMARVSHRAGPSGIRPNRGVKRPVGRGASATGRTGAQDVWLDGNPAQPDQNLPRNVRLGGEAAGTPKRGGATSAGGGGDTPDGQPGQKPPS